MIRLVTENGVPAGRQEGGPDGSHPAGVSAAAGKRRKPGAAKIDCSIELSAAMAVSMTEAMVRCGMARPDQGAHVLAALAHCLGEIVDGVSEGLRCDVYFNEFAERLETAAVMIRERMLGDG